MRAEQLESLAVLRDYGDARHIFAEVRRAVSRLDGVMAELQDVADMLPMSGSGHGTGISKPTEARALWLACDAPVMKQQLEDERKRLEMIVGHGLVLSQLVREGLGDVYGDVLEARYIDAMQWRDVAESVGYSVPHAKRMGGVALDWLDYQSGRRG